MSWLLTNWIWILLGAAFIAFHLFGHGGHGGHGGHNHKAGKAAPPTGQTDENVDDGDATRRGAPSGHNHHDL
jgi:hypothetical protein